MNSIPSIAHCLSGKISADHSVTVQGWVKTRRDSKAGISFITLHDGSCHAGIQIVVPASVENYQSEIVRLTSGCAIRASGRLVASTGQGQQYEGQNDFFFSDLCGSRKNIPPVLCPMNNRRAPAQTETQP